MGQEQSNQTGGYNCNLSLPYHAFDFERIKPLIPEIIHKIVTDSDTRDWEEDATNQAFDFLRLLTGYKPAFISWPYHSEETPKLMAMLCDEFAPGLLEYVMKPSVWNGVPYYNIEIINKKFAKSHGHDPKVILATWARDSDLQRLYLGYPCMGNYGREKEVDAYAISYVIKPKDSLLKDIPSMETYSFECRKIEVHELLNEFLEKQKELSHLFHKLGVIDENDVDTGGFCDLKFRYFKDPKAHW